MPEELKARTDTARRGVLIGDKESYVFALTATARIRELAISLARGPHRSSGRLFDKSGNLALHQVAINALASHQHLRRPLLTDLSRLQHHDPIEASQGR